MRYVIAPTMSERAMGILGCVDERSHSLPPILDVLALFLQMSACVGVLVLLFAAQAVITGWNGCAWGTRSVRSMLTPASRAILNRTCSWGRAVQMFYLGTTANWTPSQASWIFTPERRVLRGEGRAPALSGARRRILELRRSKAMKGLLVLSGPRAVTDQRGRAGGVGDAA